MLDLKYDSPQCRMRHKRTLETGCYVKIPHNEGFYPGALPQKGSVQNSFTKGALKSTPQRRISIF